MRRWMTRLCVVSLCGILFGCAQSSDQGDTDSPDTPAPQSAPDQTDSADEPVAGPTEPATGSVGDATGTTASARIEASAKAPTDPDVYEDDKDEEDQ
jgi:hypothetical protein